MVAVSAFPRSNAPDRGPAPAHRLQDGSAAGNIARTVGADPVPGSGNGNGKRSLKDKGARHALPARPQDDARGAAR